MAAFKEHFKGKTVVVTGAGKGVGRALVTQLHEFGAVVYAVTRTKSDLDSLQQECPNIIPVLLDISDWDRTRETLSQVLTGPVHVLVNNAAVNIVESFMDVTSQSFDTIMNTNLKAIVNISQICAGKMIEAKTGGTIVNISTVFGIRPEPNISIYGASKIALDCLTKTMARELGKEKIKVVGMNLGYVDTPMLDKVLQSPEVKAVFEKEIPPLMPLGEVYVPMDQIVSSILFVASGLVGMMTGSAFILDGGYLTR